jgi:hypothetical protein
MQLHSVDRVLKAHQLLNDALTSINHCVQSELGDVSVTALGKYLGGFQVAFTESEHFISVLKGNGCIDVRPPEATKFWEKPSQPRERREVPF